MVRENSIDENDIFDKNKLLDAQRQSITSTPNRPVNIRFADHSLGLSPIPKSKPQSPRKEPLVSATKFEMKNQPSSDGNSFETKQSPRLEWAAKNALLLKELEEKRLEIDEVKKKNAELLMKNEELEKSLTNMDVNLQKKDEENEEQKMKISEISIELLNLKIELDEREKECINLREKLDSNLLSLEEKDAEVKQMKHELLQLEELKNDCAQAEEKRNNKSEREIKNLNDRIAEYEKELIVEKERSEQKSKELEKQKSEIAQLFGELNGYKSDEEKFIAEQMQSKKAVESLKKDLEQERVEKNDVIEENKKLIMELEKYTSDEMNERSMRTDLEQKLCKTNDELKNVREEKEELLKRATDNQHRIIELQNELKNHSLSLHMKDEEINDLKNKYKKCEAESLSNKEKFKLKDLEKKLEMKDVHLKKLIDEITYLKKQTVKNASSHQQMPMAIENDAKNSNVQALREEFQCLHCGLNKSKDELENQLEKQTSELREIRRSLNDKEKQIDELENVQSKLQSQISKQLVQIEVLGMSRNQLDNLRRLETEQLQDKLNECLQQQLLHCNGQNDQQLPTKIDICQYKEDDVFLWNILPQNLRLQILNLKEENELLDSIAKNFMTLPLNMKTEKKTRSTSCSDLNNQLAVICETEIKKESSLSPVDSFNDVIIDHFSPDSSSVIDVSRKSMDQLYNNLSTALDESPILLEGTQKQQFILEKNNASLSLELTHVKRELSASKGRIDHCSKENKKLISLIDEATRKNLQLHSALKCSMEKVNILENEKMELIFSQNELQTSHEAKCHLLALATSTIKELEKIIADDASYREMLNDKLRQTNHEIEELKRQLSSNNCEILILESRLAKCTQDNLKKTENAKVLERIFDDEKEYWKRKSDKRENFLKEMKLRYDEAKIRFEGEREMSKRRKQTIDVFKKFLQKCGYSFEKQRFCQKSDEWNNKGSHVGIYLKAQNTESCSHNEIIASHSDLDKIFDQIFELDKEIEEITLNVPSGGGNSEFKNLDYMLSLSTSPSPIEVLKTECNKAQSSNSNEKIDLKHNAINRY